MKFKILLIDKPDLAIFEIVDTGKNMQNNVKNKELSKQQYDRNGLCCCGHAPREHGNVRHACAKERNNQGAEKDHN